MIVAGAKYNGQLLGDNIGGLCHIGRTIIKEKLGEKGDGFRKSC
jgi:hypothetical protein